MPVSRLFLNRGRAARAIAPDVAGGVHPVQNRVQFLAVAPGCVRDHVTPEQLVPPVHVDVVFVPVI
jgi:hypothetical protein